MFDFLNFTIPSYMALREVESLFEIILSLKEPVRLAFFVVLFS